MTRPGGESACTSSPLPNNLSNCPAASLSWLLANIAEALSGCFASCKSAFRSRIAERKLNRGTTSLPQTTAMTREESALPISGEAAAGMPKPTHRNRGAWAPSIEDGAAQRPVNNADTPAPKECPVMTRLYPLHLRAFIKSTTMGASLLDKHWAAANMPEWAKPSRPQRVQAVAWQSKSVTQSCGQSDPRIASTTHFHS